MSILICFGRVLNYLELDGDLKIVDCEDEKTKKKEEIMIHKP